MNMNFELCIQPPPPHQPALFLLPNHKKVCTVQSVWGGSSVFKFGPGSFVETSQHSLWDEREEYLNSRTHTGTFLCSTLGSFVLTLWDILHHLEVHWLSGWGWGATSKNFQQCTAAVATWTKGSRNLSHRAVPHGNKICRSSNWFVKYQMLMFLLSAFGNATTMCTDIFYSMYDWYRMKRHDLTKKDLPSW